MISAIPARVALPLLASVALLAHTTPARAAKLPPPAPTMDAAVRKAFAAKPPGLAPLLDRGATFERVLLTERLGGGARAAAEVRVRYQGVALRLPVKLRRVVRPGCADQWQLSWLPAPTYTKALLAMATSGALPKLDAAPQWVAQRRLPTLPVIVTRARLITPYGVVASKRGVKQTLALTGIPAIDPPAELLRHVNTWTKHFLENAPGPAAFEVFVEGGAPWSRFQQVVVGVASQGYFRIYLVVRNAKGLGVIPATAPVFGSLPGEGAKKPVPLVFGFTPTATGAALRVSVEGKLLAAPGAKPCAPGAALCLTDPAQLKPSLQKLLATLPAGQRARLKFATFGATKDVTMAQALPWLAAIPGALQILPRRVFTSYIRGKDEGRKR